MNYAKMTLLGLAGMLALLSGCAKAKVEPTVRASQWFPKPDMIVVNNFAVDPRDVQLDRGLLAKTMRDDGNRTPNAEETQVGKIVSDKLATTLIEELRNEGIPAVRPGPQIKPTDTTVTLNGEFLTVDQGNQTARVWVGFGLGGSELRTRIQATQNGQLLAQADTRTKSSLKPGMLTSAGASAAAESGTAVAVGAATTGLNEAFFATVEADARRTAKEVAKKIKEAYQERGWLN
jgi:hypothetical protein